MNEVKQPTLKITGLLYTYWRTESF